MQQQQQICMPPAAAGPTLPDVRHRDIGRAQI
jgi:hypothetical protein